MGGCCSKSSNYGVGDGESKGGVAKGGVIEAGSDTPKLNKLQHKESFVKDNLVSPVVSNGGTTVENSRGATTPKQAREDSPPTNKSNGNINGGIKATEELLKSETDATEVNKNSTSESNSEAGNITSISVSEVPQVSKVHLGGELQETEEVKLIQKNEESSQCSSMVTNESSSTTVSVTQSSTNESKEISEKTVVVIKNEEDKVDHDEVVIKSAALDEVVSNTTISSVVQNSSVVESKSLMSSMESTLQQGTSEVQESIVKTNSVVESSNVSASVVESSTKSEEFSNTVSSVMESSSKSEVVESKQELSEIKESMTQKSSVVVSSNVSSSAMESSTKSEELSDMVSSIMESSSTSESVESKVLSSQMTSISSSSQQVENSSTHHQISNEKETELMSKSSSNSMQESSESVVMSTSTNIPEAKGLLDSMADTIKINGETIEDKLKIMKSDLEKTYTNDDKMMRANLDNSNDMVLSTGTSKVSVQQMSSSSSTSQSVSMSTASANGTGDSEPMVVSKVEETISKEESAKSSALQIVNGEIVSSKEEGEMSKIDTAKSKVQCGDIIVESSACLSEAVGLKVEDGQIVESHQESDFQESIEEHKKVEPVENAPSDIVMDTENIRLEHNETSSSPLLKRSRTEVNEIIVNDDLPPPPAEDFPPPPPPEECIDDLPPPSDFLPPPTSVLTVSVDDKSSSNSTVIAGNVQAAVNDVAHENIIEPISDEDDILPPAPIGDEVDSPTGSRSSYVALVSPTGFVSSARDETDANRRVFTSSLLLNDVGETKINVEENNVNTVVIETSKVAEIRSRKNSISSNPDEETAQSQLAS